MTNEKKRCKTYDYIYANLTAVCRTARTVVWEGLVISPYPIGKKGEKRLVVAATVDEILRSPGDGIRDLMELDRYRIYPGRSSFRSELHLDIVL